MKRAALVLAFNVVASLVLVELGLRVLRPAPLFERIVVDDPFGKDATEKLQYVLSPNRDLVYVPKPGSGEFNADGYRGALVPRERRPGRTRIVMLGDSVVEGFGVDADERFTSLLAARLGPGYEIVNLGVRGYGLLQELEYLKEKGLAYAPDHVTFGISYNDLWVRSAEWRALARKFEQMERSAFYRSYYGVRDGLHARLLGLHLYRHAFHLWTRTEGETQRFALQESEERHTLDRVEIGEILDELLVLADAHGFGVSLLLLPVNGPRGALDAIGTAAQQRGFPVLDLEAEATRAFSPVEKVELFLSPHDPCHLTPRGNAWAAERIHERIDALLGRAGR